MMQQKKKQPVVNSSILESLRELSGGIGKSVSSDLVRGIGDDALRSVFGAPPDDAGRIPKAENPWDRTERPLSPFFRKQERVREPYVKVEEKGLEEKINAVRLELKALSASLKSLNQEVEKAVSEVPVDPGIYHLNYFERLKAVLSLLRQQIDDSRSWLTLWSTRKTRKSYWGMYKKHGTTFGLSQERTLATQAG